MLFEEGLILLKWVSGMDILLVLEIFVLLKCITCGMFCVLFEHITEFFVLSELLTNNNFVTVHNAFFKLGLFSLFSKLCLLV